MGIKSPYYDKSIGLLRMTTDPVVKYWPQIIAVIAFAFALGGAHWRIDALAQTAEENKKNLEQEEKTLDEVNEKITRLEVKQEVIREDVDEIKEDVKEILKAVRSRDGS